MGYSLFQPATLGMKSQSHALNTLATNIANINTSGYKRTDTRFSSVLGGTILTGAGNDASISFADRDFALGGVKPVDFQRITGQGTLTATERDLDLAIAGTGFFQVSPTIDVSGEILYTRDGGFNINIAGPTVSVTGDDGNPVTVSQGFLADKNGFFVLGFSPNADGTFPTSGTAAPMRVDNFAFTTQFTETQSASLQLNLPANDQLADTDRTFPLQVVDSNGNERIVTLNFTKTETNNEWQVTLSGDDLTTSTLTAATVTSPTIVADRLVFDDDGSLASPTSYTVNGTWDDGSTSNFTLDLSNSTQFNGQFTFFNADQDGQPTARLRKVSFDTAGHVVGEFEDGSSRLIYKIPLAVFPNADGLEMRNGNVFAVTPFSGAPRTVVADLSGVAELAPNTLELSNALLPQEFTRMIQVQQAYNSSATVFKVVDEMTIAARDLKA